MKGAWQLPWFCCQRLHLRLIGAQRTGPYSLFALLAALGSAACVPLSARRPRWRHAPAAQRAHTCFGGLNKSPNAQLFAWCCVLVFLVCSGPRHVLTVLVRVHWHAPQSNRGPPEFFVLHRPMCNTASLPTPAPRCARCAASCWSLVGVPTALPQSSGPAELLSNQGHHN
jgi:hypothetical protein